MNHLNPPKSPHVTNLRDQDEDDEETVRETLRFINSATSGSATAAAHQPRSTSMYDPTPPPPLPPTTAHHQAHQPQQAHQVHQVHQPHQHAYETQPIHEKYEEHVNAPAHALASIPDISDTSATVPNATNIPVVQKTPMQSSTSIIVMTAGVVFVLATIIPLSKVAKMTVRATKVTASCAPQIETIMRTALFVSLFLGSMHVVNNF